MTTEIDQVHERRKSLAHQIRSRLCAQHLPRIRHAHEPRSTIHRRAVIVAITQLRFTRMQAHPHPQRTRDLPHLGTQRELRHHRSIDPITSSRERGMDAVTRRLHDMPAMRGDRLAQNRIMTRQRGSHRVRVLLPQTRRTTQVREQKRDRPGRQPRHQRAKSTRQTGPPSPKVRATQNDGHQSLIAEYRTGDLYAFETRL